MNECINCQNGTICMGNKRKGSHANCFQPKPMTNFDRIKNMSVEEMADLLAKRNFSCMPFCKECENCNQNTFKYPLCIKGIKEWLESEVEGE